MKIKSGIPNINHVFVNMSKDCLHKALYNSLGSFCIFSLLISCGWFHIVRFQTVLVKTLLYRLIDLNMMYLQYLAHIRYSKCINI
jgi:hypothetical protein